jgi:tRNA G18 (ribose-2'-O)-methylase SpoU
MDRNIINIYNNDSDEEIKKKLYEKSYNYDILSFNIHSCLNIGNMIRSSNLCGIRKFIIFGRRHYDKRSAVGAQHYSTIERIYGLKNGKTELTTTLEEDDYEIDENVFIDFIKKNNYIPVFIEQDNQSIMFNNQNVKNIIKNAEKINKTIILIFGNESIGIPQNILNTRNEYESFTLELNQSGCIQSFNVSNCASIVMYKFMECFQEFN